MASGHARATLRLARLDGDWLPVDVVANCASETRRCHAGGDSASARRDPRASPRSHRDRLSRMVRFQGRQCRAQRVLGAYRHIGLHLLERREHAATTSQQGFRNQRTSGRRGCDRPGWATPPRGGRGGVPPRRPEGHVVPVAVPVIPRGLRRDQGPPGWGGISATHWRTCRATSNGYSAAPRDIQMLPGCDEPESSLPRRGQAAVRRHLRRRRPWPGPRHVCLTGARPGEPRPRRPARPRQPAVVQQDPHRTPRRPARGRRSGASRRRHRSPRRGPARRRPHPPRRGRLDTCGPTPNPTTPPTSPSSPHPYARPRPGEASTSTPRPSPRNAAHHLWTPIRPLAQRHEAREEADMEPHELMTTEEVAEHFRVNPSTVRRWRLDGVGPRFVKIGSVYRYPRVHLSEWIAARIGDRVAS